MSLRVPVHMSQATSRIMRLPSMIRTLSQSSNELSEGAAPEKALCPVTAKKILMALSDQLVEIASDGTVAEPRSLVRYLGVSEHVSGNFERAIENEASRKQFWRVTRFTASTGMPQRWNGVLGGHFCEALVLDTTQYKQRGGSFKKSTSFLVGIRRIDSTEQGEELSLLSPFASDDKSKKQATPPEVLLSLVNTTASLDEKLAAVAPQNRIHERQERLGVSRFNSQASNQSKASGQQWMDLGTSFSKLSASAAGDLTFNTFITDMEVARVAEREDEHRIQDLKIAEDESRVKQGSQEGQEGQQGEPAREQGEDCNQEQAKPVGVEAEIQTNELVCHRCNAVFQGDIYDSFSSSGARSHQDVRPPKVPKAQEGRRPSLGGRSTRPASPQCRVDTPKHSCYGSVVMAMLHWQLPYKKEDFCCRWHAAVYNVLEIADKMQTTDCNPEFYPLQGWQCKDCQCVNPCKGLLCDICGARPPRGALKI